MGASCPLVSAPACPFCESNATSRETRIFSRCSACQFVFPTAQLRPGIDPDEIPRLPGFQPGEVLRDRYRITAVLGAGASGVTFLADHLFLNHPCVVKALRIRVADSNASSVVRLKAEASAGFRVNHPHVVRVFDGDTIDDVWFIVMEFIGGCTLDDFRSEGVRPSTAQLAQLAREAAAGLAAIHAAGLIHRDIKPGNMLLGTDGRLRIADMGLAGLAGGPAGEGLAVSESSIAYQPPEALEAERPPDTLGDLYALGASLYEIATGRRLRIEGGLRALLGTQFDDPQWPADGGVTPRWLSDAILRLLAVDPERRFQKAQDFIDALAAGCQVDDARATATTETPPPPTPTGIVIPVFINAGGNEADDWLGYALADQLSRGLVGVRGLLVADREEYARLVERLAGARPSAATAALEAASLVGAASVLVGSFVRSGERIRVELVAQRSDGIADLGSLEGSLADLVAIQTALERRVRAAVGARVSSDPLMEDVIRVPEVSAQQRCLDARRAYYRGEYEEAIRLATEAIAIDPCFGDALGLVGVCCAKSGRYDAAVSWHERQQRLARETGDTRLGVEALANLGAMHYFRGDYESAYRFFTQAAQEAAQHGFGPELAKISNNLGFVLFQLGRIDEAEVAYQRAIESHRVNRVLTSLIGPYNGMGNVLCAKSKPSAAAEYYRKALLLAQESEDRVNVGIGYTYLGRCAAQQGRLSDAKIDLAMALNILEKTRFWNGLARAYETISEIHLRTGDWVEAARCADKRIELARQHGNQRMEESAWKQRLEALQKAGREREAAQCRLEIERLQAPRWEDRPAAGAGLVGSGKS